MLHRYKLLLSGCFLLFSSLSYAEGIIDINPYVSSNISYDDNVFRFFSSDQARVTFGSSATSDVIKRIDVGINVNVTLSRQILTFSSNINESDYNRFDILDNTGKSNRLGWNWRLGNDLYGEISANEVEAIAGFTEIRQPVKNLRTTKRQSGVIHWNFMPNWYVDGWRENIKTENELIRFNGSDREDDIYEAGIRYQNLRGTQLGVSYRIQDSLFPNRATSIFADENIRKDIVISGTYVPTGKTRISTRISKVDIDYTDLPQRNFSGFSQRWNLDHALTGKTNLNFTVYREVSPIDDVLSTYVKTKGFAINPLWNATSKVSMRAGLGYEERDFLGNPGFFVVINDRHDEVKFANISLSYTPTDKSIIQLQYQREDRDSNQRFFAYTFNNINLLFRYDF